MLTPPTDLTTDQITHHLRTHWAIEDATVTYLAAGHGSHNYVAHGTDGRRWFVKANRSGPDSEFFQTTYETAAELAASGLDFVSAPIRSRHHQVLPRVSDRWDLGLFPHIEGRNPDLNKPAEREQVAEILGRLHALAALPTTILRWEPSWLQPELRHLLTTDLDQSWTAGPFSEPTRQLLATHRDGIEQLLDLSDELVTGLTTDEPFVVTHGEPHAGNTMLDGSGAMHLIDCDAVMLAPRERDLRLLLHGSHRRPLGLDNDDILTAYQHAAGPHPPRPDVLELFRAEWHLIEIARYATLFAEPHTENADTRTRWHALNRYVPVHQNWTNVHLK